MRLTYPYAVPKSTARALRGQLPACAKTPCSGATLAQACTEARPQPSPRCCDAIFAAANAGGVRCLCNIPDTPYMIVTGLGSRFLIDGFVDCGGVLPGGDNASTICISESDLPTDSMASGRSGLTPPSPPLVLAPPPPPPQHVEASSPPPPLPTRDPVVPVAVPWYSDHLKLAIKVAGGIVGGLLLVVVLFCCVHRGGPEGLLASTVISRLVDHIVGTDGRTPPAPNRTGFGSDEGPTAGGDRDTTPPPSSASPVSNPTSPDPSPPTPRLRPARRVRDQENRPPGGERWR